MSTPKPIPASELILNADGSIYHLGLRPEHLAPVIITVGDPERVSEVSRHFDKVSFRQNRREFVTHVGRFAERPIMCVSTGIGTDNVDVVLSELDALANIDFDTCRVRPSLRQLTFLRLGTSGTFQPGIEVDTLLVSWAAIGLDGLGPFYAFAKTSLDAAFSNDHPELSSFVYSAVAASELLECSGEEGIADGITLTCAGFYGPQRRTLRLAPTGPSLETLATSRYTIEKRVHRLTNFEMETAGIYGLAALMGHRALSISAILANRATGTFSKTPADTVDLLLTKSFDMLRRHADTWWES